MFRCSVDTVRRRARSGTWPHYRDGSRYLFSQKQIEEILKGMEVVAKSSLPTRRGQRGRIERLLRDVSWVDVEKRLERIG